MQIGETQTANGSRSIFCIFRFHKLLAEQNNFIKTFVDIPVLQNSHQEIPHGLVVRIFFLHCTAKIQPFFGFALAVEFAILDCKLFDFGLLFALGNIDFKKDISTDLKNVCQYRQVRNVRRSFIAFPLRNRICRNAQHFGKLFLSDISVTA